VQLEYYYDPCPDYSKEVFMMGNKLNISRMINNICEYPKRQQLVVNCVKDILAKEPERKIIILSDRRAHLENVGKLLAREGIENGNYFGGMKPNELKVSESKQVLLGTFCMVSEGFDCKTLDTLILASPKSDVIQSCGRILREEASKRRYVPLIVDIIDQFSIFERQGKKRLTYYKSQKYNLIGEQKTEDVGKIVALKEHAFVDLEG
jgi:superfamily II DNA or RNA helicase